MSVLRPYQQSTCDRVVSSWQRGNRRVLVASPTGSGKTEIAIETARNVIASGGCVLVVVDRKELCAQTIARFQRAGLRTGGLGDMVADVIVAMVQTLASRGPCCLPWQPALSIWDEAHHLQSPLWQRVYGWPIEWNALLLTATPWPIPPHLVDDLIVAAQPSELERQDYLSPMRIVSYGEPDTSHVIMRGDELDTAQLAAVTNVSELRGDVLQTYLTHCPTLQAFGFAVDIAHSKALAADFCKAGIRAEHIDGTSPDREDVLARFRSGATQVLWNCDLLGEGLDIDGAQVAIMARRLESLRAYLQQAGRPRAKDATAWILDHGGNVARHGHPRMDRDYRLIPKAPRVVRKPVKPPVPAVPRLRLVVECAAEEFQIEPELQALGFEVDAGTHDASEDVTERNTRATPDDAMEAA